MPLPRQEVDATTPKYLRDKYAIVGSARPPIPADRGSRRGRSVPGRSGTRSSMPGSRPATRRHAQLFGRGLDLGDVHRGDLGCRLNFYMDVVGGGRRPRRSSASRSASSRRACANRRDLPGDERVLAGAHRRHRRALGGAVAGDMLHNRAYGWQSAGQSFAPTFYAPHVRFTAPRRAGPRM